MKKLLSKNLIALFALGGLIFAAVSTAEADVSNVKAIVVAKDGAPTAVYYREANGTWAEIGVRADSGVKKFDETARDQYSIYLNAGGQSLQLDTYQKQVHYEDASGRIPNLYQIVSVIK